MIDQTDMQILELLRQNAKIQFRDIGEVVHLTGQAVSNRIAKMESLGIIKGYTVLLDEALLGKTITAYVMVFMKSTDHKSFLLFIRNSALVIEANRISGEGCYILKVSAETTKNLNDFLDRILVYGNYRVNISIGIVK